MIQQDLFGLTIKEYKNDKINNYLSDRTKIWNYLNKLGYMVKLLLNREILKKIKEDIIDLKIKDHSIKTTISKYKRFNGNYEEFRKYEYNTNFNTQLRHRYELTRKEYDQLIKINNQCSICGTKYSKYKLNKTKNMKVRNIDHNKKDKENGDIYFIMGMCCNGCNIGFHPDDLNYHTKRYLYLYIYECIKKRKDCKDFFDLFKENKIYYNLYKSGWCKSIFKFHRRYKKILKKEK